MFVKSFFALIVVLNIVEMEGVSSVSSLSCHQMKDQAACRVLEHQGCRWSGDSSGKQVSSSILAYRSISAFPSDLSALYLKIHTREDAAPGGSSRSGTFGLQENVGLEEMKMEALEETKTLGVDGGLEEAETLEVNGGLEETETLEVNGCLEETETLEAEIKEMETVMSWRI